MKKALSGIIITTCAVALMQLYAVAEGDITVKLDGATLSFDQPPIIINDRTMVPMRAIFEALGYDVQWNDSTKVATATNGENSIAVGVGWSGRISTSSGLYEADVSPQIVSGRLLLPLRSISECAGCTVNWDGATQTVTLQSGEVKQEEHDIDLNLNSFTINSSGSDRDKYEYFRTNIFPMQQVTYTDYDISERAVTMKEESHCYIDIDNDGNEELVISAKEIENEFNGYMTIWKLYGTNIIKSLYSKYFNSSFPLGNLLDTYSFVNNTGKNYMLHQSYQLTHGENELELDMIEFKNNKIITVENASSSHFGPAFYSWVEEDPSSSEWQSHVIMNGKESDMNTLYQHNKDLAAKTLFKTSEETAIELSYQNVIANKIAIIENDIKYGDYLSAIQTADDLLSKYELSDEDCSNISALRQKAQERYDAYVNGTLSFYDASKEIEQIKSDARYNLERALENCEQTLAWHELSPEDIKLIETMRDKVQYRVSLGRNPWDRDRYDYNDPIDAFKKILTYIRDGKFEDAMALCDEQRNNIRVHPGDEEIYNDLYERAYYDQVSAMEGSRKISSDNAISIVKQIRYAQGAGNVIDNQLAAFGATDLGDCYLVEEWSTPKAHANFHMSYRVHNNGMAMESMGAGTDPQADYIKNGIILHYYQAGTYKYTVYAE